MPVKSKVMVLGMSAPSLQYCSIKMGGKVLGYFPICTECLPDELAPGQSCCIGFVLALSVFGTCQRCKTEYPFTEDRLFIEPTVYTILRVSEGGITTPATMCAKCAIRKHDLVDTKVTVVLHVVTEEDVQCFCGTQAQKVKF